MSTPNASKQEQNDDSNNPKTLYDIGDKVLCAYGARLWEADIKMICFIKNSVKYFVHCKKWKSNTNEWVSPNRLMPFDLELLKSYNKGQSNVDESQNDSPTHSDDQDQSDNDGLPNQLQPLPNVNSG